MKRYVIGDIHGAYLALKQVLKICNFDKENDLLISLGDISDGWEDTKKCVDELLTIKNLIVIASNHDQWTLNWMLKGETPNIWTSQGGKETINSYVNREFIPKEHINFFVNSMATWYYELDNMLFVHGGVDPYIPIEEQSFNTLLWDRELIDKAYQNWRMGFDKKYMGYTKIYVGHTTTEIFSRYINKDTGEVFLEPTDRYRKGIRVTKPLTFCNVTMMDTGGGWTGKLSIMDIDSLECFRSDYVCELYRNSDRVKK